MSSRTAGRTKRGRLPRLSLLPSAFAAAVFLGGGAGVGYPLITLSIQLLALVLLVRSLPRFTPGAAGVPIALVIAAAILLALLQLVPLPPAWWQALPERGTAAQLYMLLGWEDRWRPLSLTPDLTAAMLLAFIPAIAAMVTTATLSGAQRVVLLRAIVGAAAIASVFAALQVAAGEASAPLLYDTAHRGYGVGFFVNRNHQATFLLVAIVLAAVPGVVRIGDERRLGSLALVAFLTLGVLATSSRTALLLLVPVLFVAMALVVGIGRARRPLIVGIALYGLGGFLIARTELIGRILARFGSASEELRYQYWDNTLYASRAALPWGTGFGSFERVYRSIEPLSQVSPLGVNHAHNDYLELLLEGGVPALILVLAALVAIAILLAAAWRRTGARHARATALAAGSGLAVVLLFSAVDYPLRMSAIACLFGALLGLCIPAPAAIETASLPMRMNNMVLWCGAILLGLFASADAVSDMAARHGQPVLATRLAPWSALAWSKRADAALIAGDPADARQAARRALAIVPIDAEALRTHGSSDISLGDTARGDALLQAGAALGWRDTLTQLWLAQRALAAGASTVAAERIDALLRRGQFSDVMMRQMRNLYRYPGGPDAIIARLADRPKWRAGLLNALAPEVTRSVPQGIGFLRGLAAAKVPGTVEETALMRWQLADRDDYAGVSQFWRASGGRGLLQDGGFEHGGGVLPAQAAPYAWRALPLAGIRVIEGERGEGAERHSMQIASDGLSAGEALAQTIVLPLGRYRIAASLGGGDVGVVPAALTLRCVGATSPEHAIALGGADAGAKWRQLAGVLAVPADCPAQVLAITVVATAGQPFSLWIDDIRIEPMAR